MAQDSKEQLKNAFAAMKPTKVLSSYQFAPKALGADDLAVDVSHCGICHSDIHKMLDEWSDVGAGHTNYPLVPGHEVIGVVVAAGANVKNFKVGDRVGFGPQRGSCLNCEYCHEGDEQLCERFDGLYDPETGGYADHIRVHNRFAFLIPDKIDSASAAPLLCAGVTVYAPLAYYKPKQGAKVAVVGLGGLGHLGLQYAKAMGYDVTAISSSADKEAEAKSFGAAHFLNSKNDNEMKAAARKFDFIMNTASGSLDWNAYLSLLKPNGQLCLLGIPSDKIKFDPFSVVMGRKTICGSIIGGVKLMKEMLDFSAAHNIRPKIEVFKLGFKDADKATEVIEKVLKNQVRYRAVFEYTK